MGVVTITDAELADLKFAAQFERDRCRVLEQMLAPLREELDEVRNLLTGAQRDRDAVQAVNSRLDLDLAAVRRQLTAAEALIRSHGLEVPVPIAVSSWYSCAVCSLKTDEEPTRTLKHDCCGRLAMVGPCCANADAENVGGIMAGSNHAIGCRGRRR